MGLSELKDILWKELNNESNKLEPQISTEHLVHRSKDISDLNGELLEAGEDFEYEYEDIEEDDIDIEESYEDDFEVDSER